MELSYIAGKNVKWSNHFRKQSGNLFLKLSIIPVHPTPRSFPKRTESICPYSLYTSDDSSFICNNQILKIYHRWMNKKCVCVHMYSGIIVSSKKEWTINTCNNMDRSRNSYAEWKKPNQKDVQILCFHLYRILENADWPVVTATKSVVA